MKSSNIMSWTLAILSYFTVLFDTNHLAVGAQYVTLPGILTIIANGMGSLLWIFGAIYVFASAMILLVIFNGKLFTQMMDEALQKDEIEQFEAKWYTWPMAAISLLMAIIATASGFWFTGPAWFVVVIMARVWMVKCQSSPQFKEKSFHLLKEAAKENG